MRPASIPELSPSQLPLAEKVVVITGASRGIGAATAIACARAGAGRVVLIARSETDLVALARTVRDRGTEATVYACDITDNNALQRVILRCDRLDVLVNCAGTNKPQWFEQVTEERSTACGS